MAITSTWDDDHMTNRAENRKSYQAQPTLSAVSKPNLKRLQMYARTAQRGMTFGIGPMGIIPFSVAMDEYPRLI